MAHVTIPMSTSAPVSGFSHEDRSKLLSPHFKYGSLKYADVSKVEVLDVNENFSKSNEDTSDIDTPEHSIYSPDTSKTYSPDTSKTYYSVDTSNTYSPDSRVGEDLQHRDLSLNFDLNDTEPDAELDSSQFTATTDPSSLIDHSSSSERSFGGKNSTSNHLDFSADDINTHPPEYCLSPNKSISTIDQFGEHDSNPAVDDITSDWDVTSHNTPNSTPVKPKSSEQTPTNLNQSVHTPTSESKRTQSVSEVERVVSDAVRNILDSSSINAGEVSPQVVEPSPSPAVADTTPLPSPAVADSTLLPSPAVADSPPLPSPAVADSTAQKATDREDQSEVADKLPEIATTDVDSSKTLVRQPTYELSELEKAVQVDPTTERELIHSVINDEEAANCLISDCILADSIVALSSITTSTAPTVCVQSPLANPGTCNLRGDEIIEETSFELQAELQSELASPSHNCQFNVSITEIEVDDETTVTLTEKALHSEVFVYVSDSELDPEQNLESEMDAKQGKTANDQNTPEECANVNTKESQRQNFQNGDAAEEADQQPDPQEAYHQSNGFFEIKGPPEEFGLDGMECPPVNGEQGDRGAETNDETKLMENGPSDEAAEHANDKAEDGENFRRPDGASETEQASDLESTQDMTDVDEDLRKASEEMAKKQIANAIRKRSSVGRTEGFSESSIEDLRQAVMCREAVISKADRGVRRSPSRAVLQYQERKNKFDIRQEQLKATPNGKLLQPRRYIPTSLTKPLIGFKCGRTISIEGIINKPAQSFSISLQTAEHADLADVAMFISPSFNDKSILCNTYCHDTWGAPQIFNKKFPFTKGKKFEVKIATDTHCFKISVNGQRLLDYDHRMPVERIQFLHLEGDCVFNNIECPFVMDLPYVLDVDHGFRESSGVVLDAFIWPEAKMFELNLLCGEKARQTHASFMMKVNFMADNLVRVEMSSFCNDMIGEKAMVEGDLNIQPGQDFTLRINVSEKSFFIEVDDVELAEYDHMLPIDELGHVLIDGDISLYAVKFMRPHRVGNSIFLSNAFRDDRCCPCAIS